MSSKARKWLPIALCCLPGVTLTAIWGMSLIVGGTAVGALWSGPLGLVLISAAMLACPVSMVLTMWHPHQARPEATAKNLTSMVNCCLPGETLAAIESDNPTQRLTELRARRVALEHELTKMLPE